MEDPEEHALVCKALAGPSNCILWKDSLERRIRGDPDLKGLTPGEIKRLVRPYANSGGSVEQQRETSEEYRDEYPFRYVLIVPHEEIPRGIYVKLVIFDHDPDFPCLRFVSVHQASY
jgi:hypothetical protein